MRVALDVLLLGVDDAVVAQAGGALVAAMPVGLNLLASALEAPPDPRLLRRAPLRYRDGLFLWLIGEADS